MEVQEDSVKTVTYKKPKTVLGFFAIVLAILGTTGSAIVGLLSRTEPLHSAVPWVLAFLGFVFLGTLVGVFVTAWRDPTILMLGQVSGEDYLANRRLTLGDSDEGEYIDVSRVTQSEVITDQPAGLPEPKADEGDTNGE